jgi:hypothetical protein
MTRTSTELVRLDSLQPHPENAKLYDDNDRPEEDLKALQESVATHGLWDGFLQVHPSGVILDGHRRIRIAIDLGITEAVVTKQLDLPEDVTDWHVLRFLLDGNAQRIKSNEEKLREFAMRKVIEVAISQENKSKAIAAANQARAGKSIAGNVAGNGLGGDSRDRAAKAAGLGSGSAAEKALQALLTADAIAPEAPEAAAAIKKALNNSLGAGVKAARQATAKAPTVTQVSKPPSTPPTAPAPTMKLTNTVAKMAQKSNVIDGKRHRSMKHARSMPEFTSELAYLQAELPKLHKLLSSAETKLGKIADRYRDQFVEDRYNADFVTAWAMGWKEDGSLDYQSELEKIRSQLNVMQGAFTSLVRFTQTDEVMIDP